MKLGLKTLSAVQDALIQAKVSHSYDRPKLSRLEAGNVQLRPKLLGIYSKDLRSLSDPLPSPRKDEVLFHLDQADALVKELERLGANIDGQPPLPPQVSPFIQGLSRDKFLKSNDAVCDHLEKLILDGNPAQAIVDTNHIWKEVMPEPILADGHSRFVQLTRELQHQLSDVAFAQLCLRFCDETLHKPEVHRSPEEMKVWLDSQRSLARKLVPSRARLRFLKWPEPYRSGWNFIGGDPAQAYKDIKLPPHGYWGSHAFLVDCSDESLAVLHRAKYELRESPVKISHRVEKIVPRMIVRLLERRGPIYNALIATTDVAITRANPTVRINVTRYFTYVAGTYCVGIDGFTQNGVRDFDGLEPVKDDEHWLLLRSNHTPKAIRIVLSLITGANDPHLMIVLHDAHNFEGSAFWGPSLISFAIPSDFVDPAVRAEDEVGLFVTGIRASCARLLKRTLGLWRDNEHFEDDVKVSVTGFALDTSLGLQPTVFCLAATNSFDYTTVTRAFEENGRTARSHKIVPDNPSVSLDEINGLSRYEQCEFLKASLYFARRWFQMNRTQRPKRHPGGDSPGDLTSIGLHGHEVALKSTEGVAQKSPFVED